MALTPLAHRPASRSSIGKRQAPQDGGTKSRDAEDRRHSLSLMHAISEGFAGGMGKLAEAIRSRPAPMMEVYRDEHGSVVGAAVL